MGKGSATIPRPWPTLPVIQEEVAQEATQNKTKVYTPEETKSTQEEQQNDTADETSHDTNNITFLHLDGAQNSTLQQHKIDTRGDTKARTKTGHGKAARAARYIRNNPNIAASELAKKADISVTYARRLLHQKDA